LQRKGTRNPKFSRGQEKGYATKDPGEASGRVRKGGNEVRKKKKKRTPWKQKKTQVTKTKPDSGITILVVYKNQKGKGTLGGVGST